MFEAVELGAEVDEKTWKARAPKVREQLLKAEQALARSDRSCIIAVNGVEGAGKREAVNLLLEWMDPRGIQAHALLEPTDEERARSEMYRFWRRLPRAGRIGIFMGGWYFDLLAGHAFGKIGKNRFERELDRIADFERMLVNERTVLVKLWLHVSKKAQRKRFEKLSAKKSTAWRVTPRDWKFARKYDKFREISEHALRKTSTAEAPWSLVDAHDDHHRSLSVAQTVLDALRSPEPEEPKSKLRRLRTARPKRGSLLSALDLEASVPEEKYDKLKPKLEGRIGWLSRDLFHSDRSLVLVFEGPDAAGKGGCIRRVTHAMDAGIYDVNAVSAPSEEERAHPYLWRFWQSIPRHGKVGIFDRSWYGRVLVERVESLIPESGWQRAYEEINSFEEQLVEGGAVLRKFWLAISPEEQLRRFEHREETPYKQYKITEEDWRNRAKWDAYEDAANEMFERTSTEIAPWTLVAANDKHHARLTVLKEVARALEDAVE